MQVSEIMHSGVICVDINDTIQTVARMMRDKDVGSAPVFEGEVPVGFITDRDIVISCVASGSTSEALVSQAMSKDIICISETDDIDTASQLMQEKQVSRILVMDEHNHPVGMLSLQDLSRAQFEDINSETLSKIKETSDESGESRSLT